MGLKEVFPLGHADYILKGITQNFRWRHLVFDAKRLIKKNEKLIKVSGVDDAVVNLFANDPKVLKVIRLKDERQLLIEQGFSPKSQEITDLEGRTDEARVQLSFAQRIALARADNRRLEELIKRHSIFFRKTVKTK